jgi:hypothetical protein
MIWPACATPRLQKPCGGQALRRRQVLVIWCFSLLRGISELNHPVGELNGFNCEEYNVLVLL